MPRPWRKRDEAVSPVSSGKPERWPLYDARYWMLLAVSCAVMWLALLVVVLAGLPSAGRLHKVFTADYHIIRGSPVYLVVMTAGYTAVLLGLRRGKRWVVVCGDRGMRLQCGQRTRWQVNWRDVRAWYPEISTRGQLTALVVTDQTDRERRLGFGFFAPTGDLVSRIREAVRTHVAATEGRPRPQADPRWVPYVIVALLLFTVIVFVVPRLR